MCLVTAYNAVLFTKLCKTMPMYLMWSLSVTEHWDSGPGDPAVEHPAQCVCLYHLWPLFSDGQ